MNEADFKTAVAIIKTGTEPGVPVGEIEGRVCAALPGITDKDLEAAFERAADEFGAEGDASFTEVDGLRQFKERRRNTLNSEEESMTEAEVDPLPPDLMHRYLIYMQECFPLVRRTAGTTDPGLAVGSTTRCGDNEVVGRTLCGRAREGVPAPRRTPSRHGRPYGHDHHRANRYSMGNSTTRKTPKPPLYQKTNHCEKPRSGQSDACVAFADGAHSGGCPPEVFTLRGAARLCVLVARISRCRPASGIPGSPRSGRARRGQPASRPRGYGPVAIGGD